MVEQKTFETEEILEQTRKSSEILRDIKVESATLGSLIYEFFGKPAAILRCIGLSFLINFIVEALCRQSLYECFVYIANHTMSFMYNTLIVMFTYCIGVVLKKRYFYYMIISVLWLGLGVTSAIILSFRQTPLTAGDFLIARSAIGLFDKYLSGWQMGLLAVVVVLVIIALIFVLMRAPSPTDIKKKQGMGFICTIIVLVIGSTVYANNVAYSDSDSFASLIRAFDNYGFAYSFSVTTFDGGVDKPAGYGPELMDEIKTEISGTSSVTKEPVDANIVFLQLESFMDVNHIIDYTFSENPVPNFQKFKEEYPSGYITVPSIGGGTANTEFEVLTGMNMDYFGAGEYPYKTIMKKTTTESVCYNLKPLGYTSHAIHNYTGTFYDRNLVYKNLGFDVFIPLEYMYDVEFNKKSWAKDRCLIPEIMKALNSTEGKDFVHTVSVQGHGQYPNKKIDDSHTITMEGIPAESRAGFEYYVNELYDMDKFLLELTDALSAFDEDVVLVMWGDHLPTFPITEEQLDNGNIFQTEYVIWSNFGLEAEDRDIYSYQLSSYIMGLLGRTEGWMTKFHQNIPTDSEGYDNTFRMTVYDLLYGESYLDGVTKHQPTDMKLGIDEIKIDGIYINGDELQITGQNFNRYSTIMVDGEEYYTTVIDRNTLSALDVDIKDGSEICVAQKRASVMGLTEPYIYTIQ